MGDKKAIATELKCIYTAYYASLTEEKQKLDKHQHKEIVVEVINKLDQIAKTDFINGMVEVGSNPGNQKIRQATRSEINEAESEGQGKGTKGLFDETEGLKKIIEWWDKR